MNNLQNELRNTIKYRRQLNPDSKYNDYFSWYTEGLKKEYSFKKEWSVLKKI